MYSVAEVEDSKSKNKIKKINVNITTSMIEVIFVTKRRYRYN